MSNRLLKTFLLASVLAGGAGCRQEDLRVYEAPKELQAMAGAPAKPRVTLPKGWEEVQGNKMVLSTYAIKGEGEAKAQVTVSVLPKSDELANVNRWRSQLLLEPLSPEQMSKERVEVKVGGHPAGLYEMSGESAENSAKTRILAAIYAEDDSLWFFKMMGQDGLVAAQKAAFTQFLASFPIPGHNHDEEQPAAAPETAATPPAADSWQIPAGWQRQQPGPMQDAKYSARGGKATVTVSVFANSGGPLRPNIDRWRGQIGLEPATDEEFAKITSTLELADGKATVVDTTGSQQRLVAVIVSRGEKNWYFKLLGEPEAVGAEKNALLEFVKGTK